MFHFIPDSSSRTTLHSAIAADGGLNATMARSPEANESAGFRVASAIVHDSQQSIEDFPSDDRAMDSQYHEVTSTQRIPTKSGEEDGMHVDTDRPGSAGSSNSMPLPDEDVAILADTSASKSQEIDPTSVPFMKRPSLSRDFSQPWQDCSATFTFGQHRKRPMDLHGKRTYGTATPAGNPSKQQSGPADQRDDGQSPTSFDGDISLTLTTQMVLHWRERNRRSPHFPSQMRR